MAGGVMVQRPNGGSRGLTSDVFGFDPFRGFFGNAPAYSPEVQRTENGWTVEIPVPGYKPDQIDVTVEERILTVTGKSERRNFQRAIMLPEDVDAEGIAAKVEHGLLTLTLNLHPKAQPRKIEVKVVQ